jgi:hypothetical protein
VLDGRPVEVENPDDVTVGYGIFTTNMDMHPWQTFPSWKPLMASRSTVCAGCLYKKIIP